MTDRCDKRPQFIDLLRARMSTLEGASVIITTVLAKIRDVVFVFDEKHYRTQMFAAQCYRSIACGDNEVRSNAWWELICFYMAYVADCVVSLINLLFSSCSR